MSTTKTTSSSLSVKVTPEVKFVNFSESSEFTLMASLKAPLYKPESRAPLDLICVIDKSGSMSGEKMNLIHSTLQFIISQLDKTDSLGIVSFVTFAKIELELTKMNKEGKKKALLAVKGIIASGGDDIWLGLSQAIQMFSEKNSQSEKKTKESKRVASIWILADGDTGGPKRASQFHSGILFQLENFEKNKSLEKNWQQITFEISSQIQNIPEKAVVEKLELPFTINTFGYGRDHNPKLLKAIADMGNGMYYYIEDIRKVAESFADCLGGLLSVSAQNISIQFSTSSFVKLKPIPTKFKFKEIEKEKKIEIVIEDIQSEESKDILIPLQLDSLKEENEKFSIGKFQISYFNVISSKTESFEEEIFISRISQEKISPKDQKVDFELDKQRNRIISAEAMEKAALKGKLDLIEGRKILDLAMNLIKESVSCKDSFCVSLIEEMSKCKEAMKDSNSYQNQGLQMLNNNISAHWNQRSNDNSGISQTSYQTSNRVNMQKIQIQQMPQLKIQQNYSNNSNSSQIPSFSPSPFTSINYNSQVQQMPSDHFNLQQISQVQQMPFQNNLNVQKKRIPQFQSQQIQQMPSNNFNLQQQQIQQIPSNNFQQQTLQNISSNELDYSEIPEQISQVQQQLEYSQIQEMPQQISSMPPSKS